MKNYTSLVAASITAISMVACGGGGGGGSASTGGSSGASSSSMTPDYCATITKVSSSSASSSASSGVSSSAASESAFAQCRYDVYARVNNAATTISGSGAVSNKGALEQDLNLGTAETLGTRSTTLSVTDPSSFSLSASGFTSTFSRANGGVIGLCSTYTNMGISSVAMDYVAVATGNMATKYQSVKVTSSSGLSGVKLYMVNACAFNDTSGALQGGITSTTETLTFNADGSATSPEWGTVTAGALSSILRGGIGYIGIYRYYGTLYQTIENSTPHYYFVLRDVDNQGLSMYVAE